MAVVVRAGFVVEASPLGAMQFRCESVGFRQLQWVEVYMIGVNAVLPSEGEHVCVGWCHELLQRRWLLSVDGGTCSWADGLSAPPVEPRP